MLDDCARAHITLCGQYKARARKEDSKTGWYWLLGAFGISLPKQDKALSQYWFASMAKEWDLKLVMAWLISISFLHVGEKK